MTTALETLKANMWKAVRDREATEIGGGVFSPEELSEAYLQILALEHEGFSRRTEVCELKLAQGRFEHDQKLLLQSLKGLLEDKYLADPINADRMKQANAAYRHVSGT